MRASDIWPGGGDAFVALAADGTPLRYDTAQPFDHAGTLRLDAETEITGADGGTIPCATVLTLLGQEAASYTPERVAAITRLGTAELARFYTLFEHAPRLAYHSWTGVGQHTNATQTERAIATLYALTGATDRTGGNVWPSVPPTRLVNDYNLLPAGSAGEGAGLAGSAAGAAKPRLDHRAGFPPGRAAGRA